MELSALVSELSDAEILAPTNGGDVVVFDVVHNSRAVTPESLFCCVVGAKSDGHNFAEDAVSNGAVALIVERKLDIAVPQVLVGNARVAMAQAAAACNGHPAEAMTLVGVTGTNGKTTTIAMLRQIFIASGRRTEMIGTLTGSRTTPESSDLQRQLAQWRDSGVAAVVMEVSSHAIELHRVDALRFDVAVFTNLSRDHLDWHGSMEEYFSVKARLFGPDHCKQAVVNDDSPYGRLLVDTASVAIDSYALSEVVDLKLTTSGSSFTWRNLPVELSIAGEFNVSNALGAAHAASVLGIDDATIARGLSQPLTIEGRFEAVEAGQPFAVFVDYAHTPDGLEHLLTAAGALVGGDSAEHQGTQGRVVVVFGCGGDRDTTKRPAMGELAAQLADLVIVTSDNSRSEPTNQIIETIVEGYESCRDRRSVELVIEPDRRRAIARALAFGRKGDIVLVAGKGHETTMNIGHVTEDFDDRIVVHEEWQRMVSAS